jgi:sugar phosphate isomerase/epimerase
MSSRFGYNMAKTVALEDGIVWAAENGFRYIDFQADMSPNDLASFDDARVKRVRDLCEKHEVQIGVHPSSAINNAEYVPIVSEAVDEYINANFDLALRLGCGWMVGHGGYHFGDLALRQEVVIERMKRLVERAEKTDVMIYFENHNLEPEYAEIHYLPQRQITKVIPTVPHHPTAAQAKSQIEICVNIFIYSFRYDRYIFSIVNC